MPSSALRKMLAWALCLALVITSAFPSFALGQDGQNSSGASNVSAGSSDSTLPTTVVKVGWYYSQGFQEGMSDDEEKSGYSYEYLRRVADYNGWQLQYVYGDWSELLPKLQNGEIDVMAGVSDTPEREQTMSFPSYPMGTERYFLYQHGSNQSMDASDVSTFAGKKIGAITDNLMTTYLEQWLTTNNAHPEIVYYSGFEARDADFASGKLDAVVSTDNNVPADSGYASVVKVGEEPYYLAVTKGRDDLLHQLNSALGLIQEMDPYYLSDLAYKNFGTTVTNSALSGNEQTWLDAHSCLRVGYLDNYMPYCGTNSAGQATGLMTDVFDAMLTQLGISYRLQVEYQAYTSSDALTAALLAGEVDVAFPSCSNLWELERAGVSASSSVITSSMDLVYKGAYGVEKTDVIALNVHNGLQRIYVEKHFPEATIVECASIDECLQAVNNGMAASTVINGMRTDLVRSNTNYTELSLLQLPDTDDRCFGVRANNANLLLLLDHGLQLIGDDYGFNASYRYADTIYSYTAKDFIRENILVIAGLVLLVVAGIIVTLALYLRSSRRAQRASQEQLAEITKLNTQLESAREAAEAANAAKTSFLFNMSHDIRTPMNAITGFANLMEKHGDDPEKRADYLAKMKEASSVLLSIINNVLDMARIESGKMELNEAPWSAQQFNDTLFSLFSELMKNKGLGFSRSVDVTHEYVYCDVTKMTQVFYNILSNAYKYTESGGRVEMELMEIPCDREGYALYRTTVRDTGIGMDADFLPHLFDEFTRETTSTESKVEGTGLGMPIVKRLVDFMGGTIEVESEKDVGTTFVVTLMHRIASRSDLKVQSDIHIDPELFEGKRILLAEDNDLNAEIAVELLREMGFDVDRAEDGAVAVAKMRNAAPGHFDVVLMDVQMPNMNGYEATRAIRALDDEAKAHITILAMTANAFEEDKRTAAEAGMNGHIAKPIDMAELAGALADALSSEQLN